MKKIIPGTINDLGSDLKSKLHGLAEAFTQIAPADLVSKVTDSSEGADPHFKLFLKDSFGSNIVCKQLGSGSFSFFRDGLSNLTNQYVSTIVEFTSQLWYESGKNGSLMILERRQNGAYIPVIILAKLMSDVRFFYKHNNSNPSAKWAESARTDTGDEIYYLNGRGISVASPQATNDMTFLPIASSYGGLGTDIYQIAIAKSYEQLNGDTQNPTQYYVLNGEKYLSFNMKNYFCLMKVLDED